MTSSEFQGYKFRAQLKLTFDNLGFLVTCFALVAVATTPVVMFVRHFV